MAAESTVMSPRKLIEVALPLDAINRSSSKEKSIRQGHPSTLHLWWARRPLAAARAVIFSQMVNDPEDLWWHQNPGAVPNKQVRGHWTKARQRLFKIIEDLVLWENTTNEDVLERARDEIRRSWRDVCELNKHHPSAGHLFNHEKMPGLHDPFAGGGAIPLEAQRLGLEACASDLNPVAVLINRAMIEIPPQFSGLPPIHPDVGDDKTLFTKDWKRVQGLAEDVLRYGRWVQHEATKRIGQLYPQIQITADMAMSRPDLAPLVGQSLTVIAWIWARTVKSPNPAFSHVDVPLANTFLLSAKEGKEAYVVPIVRGDEYAFDVQAGTPIDQAKTKAGTTAGRWQAFRCILSGVPIDYDYIRTEGVAGRMGQRLMAIVADGPRGRIYLAPHESHARSPRAADCWKPALEINYHPRDIKTQIYGLTRYCDLFTPRQLLTLNTLADLIHDAHGRVESDAKKSGVIPATEATPYATAVATLLTCALQKTVDYNTTICTWISGGQTMRNTFGRQAIPMTWDFAEAHPLADATGSFSSSLDQVVKVVQQLPATIRGQAFQQDAQTQSLSNGKVVSTDPPYYDNIGYADLSDFFYVWLRRTLKDWYPDLCATIQVPKAEELVATPYRHGSKEAANEFFQTGMQSALKRLAESSHPAFPTTVYYAFKQSEENESNDTHSTGWDAFLDSTIKAGFSIVGTWPMRTELGNRMIATDANALASSIVLVCRPRPPSAGQISRRQFVRLLNETLPDALSKMTGVNEGGHSPVAPVDLSQAIIGPGMAIFSRYDAVLEADGTPMTVKTALQLINRFLAEDDFDGDTQFCLHWFEQHGWEKAKFGEADTLARAKGTSVDGVKAAGVIESGAGNVRLLKWKEYPTDWNPSLDTRLPVWEALHQMIRAFSAKGVHGAAKVLKGSRGKADAIRQLAYRLYTLCERKGWAEDARAYNDLIVAWPDIERGSGEGGEEQRGLFDG